MSSNASPRGVSRRSFLKVAAISASAAAIAGPMAITSSVFGSKHRGSVTRNPLYKPPVVPPMGVSLRGLELTAAPGTVNLGGKTSKAWVYNGGLPGPTLVARKDETATITLVNRLPESTITHWHGMLVDHANDGQPVQAILPGAEYRYNFLIKNRAALNWYHPHPHLLTGKQVGMGLAGGFIIRDAEEDLLGLPSGPSGSYEVPLVLRDTAFDSTGNIAYKSSNGGFEGPTPLVNGTLNPYLNVEPAVYRFRLLGGANARIFGLALGNGAPFVLIGNDGGLLSRSESITQVDLGPGERLDLLVDFRSMGAGSTVMLRDLRAGWDLLEFRRVGSAVVNNMPTIPVLSTITPLGPATVTRSFSFDGMSRINGLVYDMHRIDFTVPFNVVERWQFTTGGNAPHPVHIHGASFQVVSRTGGRNKLFPWESGWKDTVMLEDGETVEVLIRFDAYKGIYVMHCHKLEHEDNGMMLNFEVISPPPNIPA